MRIRSLGCLAATVLACSFALSCGGYRPALMPGPDSSSGMVARTPAKGELPVRILDEAVEINFDERGTWSRTYRSRYRILNAAGVESWGQSGARWSPWYMNRPVVAAKVVDPRGVEHLLDPRTIAEGPAGGESQDTLSDGRVVQAPLPAIEVGSVVEEMIQTSTHAPFFVGGELFYTLFAAAIPKDHVKMVVRMPEAMPFRFEVRDVKVAVSDTKSGGVRTVTFEGGPYEALEPPEAMLPTDLPLWPHVAFTTGDSWQRIAAAYEQIVRQQVGGANLEALVGQIVQPSDAPLTKAQKLLSWMRANIRFAGIEFGDAAIVPRAPAEVLQRRYGDCKDQAALLVAMLETAGIRARVALLLTGSGPDVRQGLPAINAFDHAIVYIPGPAAMWIDPTADYARAGDLPTHEQGRLAMVADKDTVALAPTPRSGVADNTYVETREIVLPDHGRGKVVESTTGTGALERILRASMSGTRESQQESLTRYVEAVYGSKKLGQFNMSKIDDLSVPFALQVGAEETTLVATDVFDGVAVVRTGSLWGYLPEAMRQGEPRKSPLQLAFEGRIELRLRVVGPEGFVAGDLPRAETRQLGPAKYEQSFAAQNDGVVTGVVRLTVPGQVWRPDEVEAFRKGLKELQEAPAIQVPMLHRGNAQIKGGHVAEGIGLFRSLADRDPNAVIPRARYAYALATEGFGAAARQEARRIVSLAPSEAWLWRVAGDIFERDELGRLVAPGFERTAAMDAFRKALAVDATDIRARVALAQLLEHDEAGRRFYATSTDLQAALSQYDAADAKDLAGMDDGAYTLSPAVVAFRLGRFEDVSKRLTGKETDVRTAGLLLAAKAAMQGPGHAIQEAESPSLQGQTRLTALATAAENLIPIRHYSEAAALLEAAAQGADNAVEVSSRARIIRKLRRIELADMSDSTPDGAARRVFFLALNGALTDDKSLGLILAPEAIKEKGVTGVLTNLREGWDSGQRSRNYSSLPGAAADWALSGATAVTEGSDRNGYRVKLTAFAALPSPTVASVFVVKTPDGYRVRAIGDLPSTLGTEARARLDAGEGEAARQWLAWAADLFTETRAADPVANEPFLVLHNGGKGDARVAAAALQARGNDAARAIDVLVKARASEKDTQRQLALDVAIVRAYEIDHQGEKMLDGAKRLVKEAPSSKAARNRVLDAFWLLHRYEAARSEAKARLDAGEKEMRWAVARAEAMLGRLDAAMAMHQANVDDGIATASDYNQLAWFALVRGNLTDRDIDNALRAVQMSNFRDTGALHTLASLYADAGKLAEARQTLLKLLELRARRVPLDLDWYIVGRMDEQAGLLDAAREAYGKLKRPEPDYFVSTWRLGQRRLEAMKQAGGR